MNHTTAQRERESRKIILFFRRMRARTGSIDLSPGFTMAVRTIFGRNEMMKLLELIARALSEFSHKI